MNPNQAASERFDFIIVGSGPGGQKAAICAAKGGKRVAIVEQERHLGGACVHRGTLPSKTLRENALRLKRFRALAAEHGIEVQAGSEVAPLLSRLERIVASYSKMVSQQIERNGITAVHGRARFASPHCIEVRSPGGETRRLEGSVIILAAGSTPRHPPEIPVDHEHVLDGDSILQLAYLPQSLTVLGGGVIACEYASVFAQLGVAVTIVDRAERPLGFVEEELVRVFLADFEAAGGRYVGGRQIESIAFDGVSQVELELRVGGENDAPIERLTSEKVLVALGRTGCSAALAPAAAGLEATPRSVFEVDEHGRTALPHIYAVGDLAGPPALATSAMEQGRHAVRHALGLPTGRMGEVIPTGIYTIPEMASVGAREDEVRESLGGAAVGRARLEEVARGQISDLGTGLLKLVSDPKGERILGVHVVGEGASELVHVGQMAMLGGASVDELIENVFNFPTLAEAYRVAALDLRANVDAKSED